MNNIRKASMGPNPIAERVSQTTLVTNIMPGLYIREDQKKRLSLIVDVPLTINSHQYHGSFNTRIHKYDSDKEWSFAYSSDEDCSVLTACSDEDDCIVVYYEQDTLQYIAIRYETINRTYWFHNIMIGTNAETGDVETTVDYWMYSFNNSPHYSLRHKCMIYSQQFMTFGLPLLVDAKDDTLECEEDKSFIEEARKDVDQRFFPQYILDTVENIMGENSPRYEATESET